MPVELWETGMAARRFECPAAACFAAVSLAGMIAAFAVGQTRAQPVNPPPPLPPPTFNPSSPNVVPQAPQIPVSPTAPGGLPGASTAPPSQIVEPPASVSPQGANTHVAAKPGRPHHERWSRRHARFQTERVVGPSYYPGLDEFYPPYVNPCHFSQLWSGLVGSWTYTCSW